MRKVVMFMDIIILYKQRRYIIETKLWEEKGSLSQRQATTGNLFGIGKWGWGLLCCLWSPEKARSV